MLAQSIYAGIVKKRNYRYNTRKMKDGQRFEMSLTNLEGRLSHKQLIKDNRLTSAEIIEPILPEYIYAEN